MSGLFFVKKSRTYNFDLEFDETYNLLKPILNASSNKILFFPLIM